MKLIVANWKLNPQTLEEAKNLIKVFNKTKAKHKVVICPPFVYLPLLKTNHDLGVQDIFWQESGTFTGEISSTIAKQFGAEYAIIGHSERRNIGETDQQINLKVKASLAQKIKPILCVGHGLTAAQTEDEVLEHLQKQIAADLEDVDGSKVVVAYEPVWAISDGTNGRAATPEHAERVAMFIKIKFKVKKVLYGGSANAQNYKPFLKKGVDGLLVGGASLKPEQFSAMISNS
jgi:triosephosphate isomerase (TIM)